jgi:hypothetical protein
VFGHDLHAHFRELELLPALLPEKDAWHFEMKRSDHQTDPCIFSLLRSRSARRLSAPILFLKPLWQF